MRRFKRKREIRKRLYSKPILFLLIVVLALLAHGTWGIWAKSQNSHAALLVAQKELETLQDRQESISEKMIRLDTGTGLEEEIRSKFDVAREGERLIVIVDKGEQPYHEEEKEKGIKGIFTTINSWFQ